MTAVIAGGAIAKAWLATLAMMIAQGTLLAAIAYALTRGRPVRPAWHAALWLVVIVKFALPWGPAMPWSLSDAIAALTGSGADASASPLPPALQPLPAAPGVWPALGWLALALAWACGAARVIARAVGSERRAVRAARAAEPAPAAAHDLLVVLADRIGVRAPRLVLAGAATGPHVVGIVRPIIAIPAALGAEPVLLRAALLHELAHVRRRDVLGRVVQVAAHATCWLWPVVARASRRLDLARESACDAWALEVGDVPRPAYARLLVQMASLHHAGAALATPHALDARIAAVLGPPSRPRLGHLHRLALAAWAVLALGGARSAAARGEPTCHYTPALAEQLRLAHPEADLDGDGVLSREEACELQAALRREAQVVATPLDPNDASLLAEPLCCNCDRAGAYSTPEATSCHQVEGADR